MDSDKPKSRILFNDILIKLSIINIEGSKKQKGLNKTLTP